MRLYTFQRDLNINPRDQSPRTQMLKDYLKQLTTEKYATMRADFYDRLKLTIRDSYSQLEILNHTRTAWRWGTKRTVPQALRANIDFLLGTHLAKRFGERSALAMPDLFSIDLPAHYRQRRRQLPPARCIVAVMRQGKKNTDARIQYGGALRHRDPFSYLVGAISFWYFWRLEHEKEPLPDFSDRKTWYKIRILRRSRHVRDSMFMPRYSFARVWQYSHRGTEALTGQTAGVWAGRVQKKAGIHISKPRHGPRRAAPIIADHANVPEAQIRRAGPWGDGGSLVNCFLTNLPQEFMRGMADFEPDKPEDYIIVRDLVKPPPELTRMIWPEIDVWNWALEHEDNPDAWKIDREKAAGANIKLFLWLCEVVLQDAVFFIEAFPDHPMFHYKAFRSSEFFTFAVKVRKACEEVILRDDYWEAVRRKDEAVYRIMRDLESHIKGMRMEVRDGLGNMSTRRPYSRSASYHDPPWDSGQRGLVFLFALSP